MKKEMIVTPFTPGFWKAKTAEYGDSFYVVKEESGPSWGEQIICENIQQGHDSGKADANLIAAAPQMYEALKEIIEQTESFHRQEKIYADEFNNNTPGVGQSIQYAVASPLPSWINKAKSALLKANPTLTTPKTEIQ
jgi:hypothetical protein